MNNSGQSPIQKLYWDLDAELRRDPLGPNVHDMMEQYITKNQDWKEYVNFNEHKYCRNLVGANDILELIVLCWLPGQVSPIHNHAGQHCWAAVLEGNIQETHFHFADTHSAYGKGPLEEVETAVYNAGNVSYISDDIALHVLKPVNGQCGVTLHLYSKPIAECNIYCPKTGEITKRKLGFYSIGKELEPLSAVAAKTSAKMDSSLVS